MSLTYQERADAAAMLGVYDQPGLAMGFPDLVAALNRLYVDRVAKIPWVPPDWLAAVQALQAKNPEDLIKPTPGRNATGQRGADAPSFADTDAKVDVWHKLYTDINSAIVSYAASYQAQGAAKLANLYAAAAFWNSAYSIAKFAADLPSNLVKMTAGGITDFVGSFLPDALKSWSKYITIALALLVVGGLVLWYRGKVSSVLSRFQTGA